MMYMRPKKKKNGGTGAALEAAKLVRVGLKVSLAHYSEHRSPCLDMRRQPERQLSR
jgi:hypothetical protein